MISVLIPVYNRDVAGLAQAAYAQLEETGIPAEIIVMDDGSSDPVLKAGNRSRLAGGEPRLRYIELPVNTGRNLIRHKLAEAARYNTFIFLDADSRFPDGLWLQRYLPYAAGEAIIMGGRLYPETTVASLHYYYGRQREQFSAARRNGFPYRSFMACNFLIQRRQFSALLTDTRLQGYCHEDTFMGLQFKKLQIPLLHINNPVYHEGIDSDQQFIAKQEQALGNLCYLYQAYGAQYDFDADVKLLRVHKKVLHWPCGKWLLNRMAGCKTTFRRRALRHYHLFWLDCWKLAAYHALSLTGGN